MNSYAITQIKIKNFKRITEEVTIIDIQKCNSMTGLYETLKKDLAHAIIFCMGATANQLQVNNIADVQSSPAYSCYVELHLSCRDKDDKIFQRHIFGQETFHVNGEMMGIGEYCENLRNVNIDMNKQFNFYDARNRSFFWNVETTIRNEFIAKMNGMTEQLIAYNNLLNRSKLIRTIIQCKEKEHQNLTLKVSKIEECLPDQTENHENWAYEFASCITSSLKSDEDKRRKKIRELADFTDQFRALTIPNEDLLLQIQNAERNLNELNEENRNFLQELQGEAFQPYNNQSIQSLKSRLFLLKNKIDYNTLQISDGELRLRDFETYKRSIESHLQFMNTPFDQPQDSRFITDDALLKFYQIAHSADELAFDKLSFRLKLKEYELNVIDNKRMDVEDFDAFFPQRRFPEAAETILQNAPNVFKEMKSALNSNIDPNTMLYSKSSPEILEKLIPRAKGFLLTSVIQPRHEMYKCMIDSILYNSKYTIVLYNDDKQAIYNMLKRKCPDIFLNVRFLVYSKLPQPALRFAIPETHWMQFCLQNEKLDLKLFQFMANQKNILRVESHDDVRDEFRRNTKKYVISADGQLAYTRLINVDVLEYFQPGKKPKNVEIANSNIKKTLDANEKCAEVFAALFEEEEYVTPNQNIDDGNALRHEVEDLRRQFEEAKEHQKMQMERLRANLEAPYTVPEPSDFTERRTIEQSKLDDVNGKILAIQGEKATRQAAIGNLTTQVTNIQHCIRIKNTIKVNEASCAIHSKTVKEKRRIYQETKEQTNKLNEQITRLKNILHKLKLSTMRNLVHLTTNVDLHGQPINEDMVRLFNTQEGIDPETIHLTVSDTLHPSRPVVATIDYYQEKNEALTSAEALRGDITIIKEHFRDIFENMNRRQTILENECRQLNESISNNLRILIQQLYTEFNYQINFNFNFQGENEKMIIVRENLQEIQIRNLTTTDQQIIHWTLFAAFHRYTKSPILFVDFRDSLDIITKIGPIIKWITNESQVFCYSSHEQLRTLSTFANMQIAVNKMDDEIPPFILWKRENNPEQTEE